jgi:hypothetical protein
MSNTRFGKMEIIWLEIADSVLFHQSGVCEAEVFGFIADDDVVEHADSEYGTGANEPLGALAILAAWRWIPRGMVVLCAAPSYVTSHQGS